MIMSSKKAVRDIIYGVLGVFFILAVLYITTAITSPIVDIATVVSLIIFALVVVFHEPILELLNINISI